MSARIVFRCDHEMCASEYVLDTTDAEVESGERPGLPLDLISIVRFLSDTEPGAGGGWKFAVDRLPRGDLLYRSCFCPEHREDTPTYRTDGIAVTVTIKALPSPKERAS